MTIDLSRLKSTSAEEREMLERYLGMIEVQRRDFAGTALTIRGEDIRALACLFETTTESMVGRLEALGLRADPSDPKP